MTKPQHLSELYVSLLIVIALPTAAYGQNRDWPLHGLDFGEKRFSELQSINRDNVDQLGLAWNFEFDTNRGQEATPLVVDGVLYTSSAWSKAFALDAVTGELLWNYDPVADGGVAAWGCCDVVNRGVAYADGQIFLGVIDGRLEALDAKTGELNWSVRTTEADQHYTITGAPRIVEDLVVIGNGGAEFGVRGYVTAYDRKTGEQRWRFYTVPGNPEAGFEQPELEMAAETWSGNWWQYGGGGTVWDAMAYDPGLGLLYLGVGNGSPWNHVMRSAGEGDNLFLSSIVALNATTGSYRWHYQTTPGDSWDYTATQHMVLADLEWQGRQRQVLMQMPKNGFFYVLDRETGELLAADKVVPVTWATHVDLETGRPVEADNARYLEGPVAIVPGPVGAHNWNPMSYDERQGIMYIPARSNRGIYRPYGGEPYDPDARGMFTGMTTPMDRAARAYIAQHQPDFSAQENGQLVAWDVAEKKELWRVIEPGSASHNGGLLSTAGGLLFQGKYDGRFVAYDKDNGRELWSTQAYSSILGGPVSYEVDGEQYVAVLSGKGGGFPTGDRNASTYAVSPNGRLLVFKLGGENALPPYTPTLVEVPDFSPVVASLEGDADEGTLLYGINCARCHGGQAVAGVLPDLRFSAFAMSAASWQAIVLGDTLEARGMPNFDGALSESEVEHIRAYIVNRALALAQGQ